MIRFWGGVFHGVYLVRRKGDLEFEPSTAHVYMQGWITGVRLRDYESSLIAHVTAVEM